MGHTASPFLAVHILVLLDEVSEPLTSNFLSAMTGAPPSRVRQLMQTLVRVGLIRTKLGPGGGIELARSSSAITMAEVFRAVGQNSPIVIPDPTAVSGFTSAMAAALELANTAAMAELEKVSVRFLSRMTRNCARALAGTRFAGPRGVRQSPPL